jgi:hypothetical protein
MKYYSTSHDYSGRKRKPTKAKGEVYGKFKAPAFRPIETRVRPSYADVRCAEGQQYPSRPDFVSPESCSKPERKEYTGTLVKGISTLHKSNAVPILSQEEAVEHARMRR